MARIGSGVQEVVLRTQNRRLHAHDLLRADEGEGAAFGVQREGEDADLLRQNVQERTSRVPEHRVAAARHDAVERTPFQQGAVLRRWMREPAIARADKQRRGVLVPPQRSVGTRAGKRLSDR